MNKYLLSIFCILQICAIALSVEVRRDDKVWHYFYPINFIIYWFECSFLQWPPKQMIEWMAPAAKMCKEKTGVTMGMKCPFDLG